MTTIRFSSFNRNSCKRQLYSFEMAEMSLLFWRKLETQLLMAWAWTCPTPTEQLSVQAEAGGWSDPCDSASESQQQSSDYGRPPPPPATLYSLRRRLWWLVWAAVRQLPPAVTADEEETHWVPLPFPHHLQWFVGPRRSGAISLLPVSLCLTLFPQTHTHFWPLKLGLLH